MSVSKGLGSSIIVLFMIAIFLTSAYMVYAKPRALQSGIFAPDGIVINNTNPNRGLLEVIRIAARWNETQPSGWVEYNVTSTFTSNYTTNASSVYPVNLENTTNSTLTINNDFAVGPHYAKIYANYSVIAGGTALPTYWNFTPNDIYSKGIFYVWGMLNSTVSASTASPGLGDTYTVTCTAKDANTSETISGQYIELHINGTNYSNGITGSDGTKQFSVTISSSDTTGDRTVLCVTWPNTSAYYNNTYNSSTTVTYQGASSSTTTSSSSSTPQITQVVVGVNQDKAVITYPASFGGTVLTASMDDPEKLLITGVELGVTSVAPVGMFALIIEKVSGDELSPPDGVVLAYHNFKLGGVASSRIENVKIRFAVPKAWLTENDIDRNNVVLNRYTTEWMALDATNAGEDSTYYYYQADSPGLSVFAITGQEGAGTPTVPGTPTSGPEQGEEAGPPQPISPIAIVVLIVIAGAVVWFVKYRK